MASQYISLMFLLTHNVLLHCTSAAVHIHSVGNLERESDGSYRSRDGDHYADSGHNLDFDHEAILGSVREAEQYDRLSPEESRQRLSLLLPKMDLNGDEHIDHMELKQWILNSFVKLSREEAEDRMSETDNNRDGVASWAEYLQDAFGVDAEEEIGPMDIGDTGMLLYEEKQMWIAADLNGDGQLDIAEFEMFTNPEEHEVMHPFLVNQTLREKDSNNDGLIEFKEYIGERGAIILTAPDGQYDDTFLVAEREKFDHELDTNRDGVLDANEIRRWLIPDNNEIAIEEVDHLFAVADDDGDALLSFQEILNHHDVFVGSEIDLDSQSNQHFDDEL